MTDTTKPAEPSAAERAKKVDDLWNSEVSLIDDHQAVELVEDDGTLKRVIVCCDCGLVHLMSIAAQVKRAYFVREDGPIAEAIREKGRKAGHVFTLLEEIKRLRAAEEAARAEGRREAFEEAAEWHEDKARIYRAADQRSRESGIFPRLPPPASVHEESAAAIRERGRKA